MTGHLSAADLLVRQLAACRPQLSADSRQPSAVWDEVVTIAASHGLAPLLFKRLKENGARADVPPDAWERLRQAYFASAVRNMRLFGGLRSVLRRLRSAGIPVIVLKGAYLAEAVYGDVALRPMCDVDLMVPREELSRTQATLLGMGGVHQQFEGIESRCKRRLHLPPVVIRDLAIEIHWTVSSPTGPFRVDAAGLWERARPATISGVEVLALSPEDLLLHLSLHFCYQHHLAGLRSLCDIAETIHRFRGEIDWAQVVIRAREWHASRYAGLTLHLARSMMGARVPDDVLEQLVPGGLDQRVLEAARESVFAQTGYDQWVPFFDLVGTKSLGDRARLSWERVFLSREEMAATYPASRGSRHLYLYYALRLGHVMRSYWTHTLRRGRLIMQSRGRDQNVSLVNWLKSGKPERQVKVKAKVQENP